MQKLVSAQAAAASAASRGVAMLPGTHPNNTSASGAFGVSTSQWGSSECWRVAACTTEMGDRLGRRQVSRSRLDARQGCIETALNFDARTGRGARAIDQRGSRAGL